jgi:3D (Asp-Asp-Asp) domain-containing protein
MGTFASFTLALARHHRQPAAPMTIAFARTIRPPFRPASRAAAGVAALLVFAACASPGRAPAPAAPPAAVREAPAALPAPEAAAPRSLRVRASAFNSLRGQTDATPSVGAWGDRLTPGMKAIAVSPDLIEQGLARGQIVRIHGLDGEYVVADRMPARWQRKIDIYMGEDVKAARRWGVRDVEITWMPEGN